MKIRPAAAELFHAERTDMTKLIVLSRNFAKAPMRLQRKVVL